MQEFTPNQDVIASTEIAQAMGMHPWEITSDPEKASKFNDISAYFGPYSDKSFLIQKLTRGMMKEQAIDHLWKYVGLRKEHTNAKERFLSIEKELSRYEK